MAVLLRDRAGEHRADRAVHVAHRLDERHVLAVLDRGLRLLDQRVVERALEAVVLRFDVAARDAFAAFRLVEHAREIEALRLPVLDAATHVEQIGAADQIVELRDAELRHDLARLLGDEEEVVDDVLGLTRELRAQHRVLRRDADRARVQMALAHHDAAFDDERRRREAEFVRAEQRADHDVAARLHLAVGLHANAPAQAVQHERLLRLGEAELPRRTRVLDRRQRRSARAAVVARDHDVIGLRLRDARRHRADAHLRHELHRDARDRIDVLQIVDQLREILDRIDVMVRRRRDEADARHRVAQLADVFGHLVARQLAAFARLRALRHLDLDLVGRREILGRHTEAARCDLLDLRAQRIAFLQRDVAHDLVADHRFQRVADLDRNAAQLVAIAVLVLAAFARVRLAADAVHRDRERRMRLGADRAERHRARREALDDLLRRLDFVDRNRLRRVDPELEQAAQRHVALRLIIDQVGIFLVRLVRVAARRMLQLRDRIGRPHVVFAAHAERVLAARVEHVGEHGVLAERVAVQADRLLGHLEQADAAHLRRGALEVLLDEIGREAERLEDLRAGVRHVRGDAHLRHHLLQALADRLREVVDRLLRRQVARQPVRHLRERFHREVRVHGFRAVAREQREVVRLARGARLDDEARARAQALLHEVRVDRRRREQRGNRDVLRVRLAIGHDQDVVARLHRVDGLRAQRREARLDAFLAPCDRIADVQLVRAELAARVAIDRADLRDVLEVEHGLRHLEAHRRVDVVRVEQVRLRADERHERHHHVLADRIDRRIRDLREQLLEVVVERLVLVRHHRERRIVAHRADRLLTLLRHRRHQELHVLLRVAERLLAIEQRGRRTALGGDVLALRLDLVELDAHRVDPALVRLRVREVVLQLLVVDDPAVLHVDQEHLARLQAPFLDDLRFGNRQHARFRGHDHEIVVGNDVARRAQAVAVERRADLPAVGKRDRGGAVPRLHHRGVVFVERAAVVVHQRVLLPRLGNHHHHRVHERVARHHEQLEAVVERCRIRLAGVDERPELRQIVAEHVRRDCAGARVQPVDVALDRVDFAVVRDHPVRVRELPRGERVRREALVHERERRHGARVLQVAVVHADLAREQQPLVDDRARRHRRHEVFLAVLELERLDPVARRLADHVELALQRVRHHHVLAAADEDLADHGLARLHRGRDRHRMIDRHVAPAEHDLTFGLHRALELLLARDPRRAFLRQEDHPDPIFAGRRQRHVLPGHLLAVERVRNLDQDARAVAHQRIGADRAAVIEVLEDLQALLDDFVALLALDVSDEADAAGVVLVLRVVQTLRGRKRALRLLVVDHGDTVGKGPRGR
ncbi:hypothetical protein BM45_3124 [Burkholderia mallei]|nr:hypothetical protein BM45_3124 [Burkholderia mallei]